MSDAVSKFVLLFSSLLMLAACGKNDEGTPASAPAAAGEKVYHKEDAQCFAGVIRTADEKKMSPAEFGKWESKLNDKDKIWIANYSGYHANLSKILTSHLGKTNKELIEARVITAEQGAIIDGYILVAQESDPAKAKAVAAEACSRIGFSKGLALD